MPGAVSGLAVTVSVLEFVWLDLRLIQAGLAEAARLFGEFAWMSRLPHQLEHAVVAAKPFRLVTVTVVVAEKPGSMVSDAGLTLTL